MNRTSLTHIPNTQDNDITPSQAMELSKGLSGKGDNSNAVVGLTGKTHCEEEHGCTIGGHANVHRDPDSKGVVVKYPTGIIVPFETPEEREKRKAQAASPLLIGGVNLHKDNKYEIQGSSGVVGIDWLQGSIPIDKAAMLFDYLTECCGAPPEIMEYGQLRYDRHAVWHPFGIKLFFDSSSMRCSAIHNGRCTLQLSATPLSCFDGESLFKLVRDLVKHFWFKATRIDLCFDDYERTIRPCEVVEEAKKGNFTGYRRFEHLAPQKLNGNLEGDTLYFGRRGKNGGGKYLRCYDKFLESKGEVCSIRWEVEFSKQKAKDVFFKLSQQETLNAFSFFIGALIGGSIDFVDRKGIHLERMERLEFWENIVGMLGTLKLRNPQRIKTIDKTKEWIERSVTASLEKLRMAFGDDDFWRWFGQVVAESNLSKKQLREIEDYWDKKGKPKNYQYAPF